MLDNKSIMRKFVKINLIIFINLIILLSCHCNDIPRTKEDAIYTLKTKWLSKKDLEWILLNPKKQVISSLHMPFGVSVRNAWELWGDRNPELMKSCNANTPDECTWEIFEGLWESVRNDTDSSFVQRLDLQFSLYNRIKIRYRGFNDNTTGFVINSIQNQINDQLTDSDSLKLKLIGDPNLDCYCRAEFSENNRDPVSLELLIGWLSWRNNFKILHSPPYIKLVFNEHCTWPDKPNHRPIDPPTVE